MSRRALESKLRRSVVEAAWKRAMLSLLVFTCFGCASFRPIEPGSGPISIGRNEGLLLLHVDTEIALSSIAISGVTAARNLPVGVHTRFLVAPAGSYRWDQFVPLDRGRGLRYKLRYFEDDWRFRVEAGQINYPGLIVIREGPPSLFAPRLGIYTTNRAAMMLRRLERTCPSLLAQFPMKYTGRGRDEFLERFQAAKDERRAAEARPVGSP